MYKITLDAPRGWKRRLVAYVLTPVALVAAVAAIASADNPIDASWIKTKKPIDSTLLRGNLMDLQTQLTNLQAPTVMATGSFQGNFGGYQAANNICGAALAGSHVCTATDLVRYAERGGGKQGATDQAWYASGTASNGTSLADCKGFTDKTNAVAGAAWNWMSGGQGYPDKATCDMPLSLLCCL